MQVEGRTETEGTIHVENVGGIDETTVEFSPGVSVLVGRNATNRTSFQQAVMAACGSDDVSIKGDADEARVELTLGGETYTRRLQRRSGTVVAEGEAYLEDAELADLFAFLLESNAARRAVAGGGDLRDVIMRPVDTEAIQRRIEESIEKRESLKSELAEIEGLKGDLPSLEERRAQLRADIEEKESELAATEAELEAVEPDIEETREEEAHLEERLADLRAKRAALDDVRYDLETEQESRDALENEKRDLEAELADLPDAPTDDESDVDATIERLRERKQAIETEVSELQTVIGFNEEMLEDTNSDLFGSLVEDGEAVTDRLLAEDEAVCWTCGSEVGKAQIESTVEQLRQLSQEKIGEVNDLDDEIDELVEKRRNRERARQQRDRIEQRLGEVESEIAESRAEIERLRERRTDLTEEIEDLEREVADLEDGDYTEVLDLHREANQLEYDIGRLETQLEDVEDEISSIESRIEERDDVRSQLEAVEEEITDARTRIDRIEERAIEGFNEHMETVLDLLDYTNLDRIWIERVEREVREGRRAVEESAFELHVVRTTESGAAYEDTVDHLSESEREVTGLVFALAGYLAHEVYEDVPFMLLDSLEALDPERIAALVEYLREYTGYLLVALLPEDAAVLDEDHERVTEI